MSSRNVVITGIGAVSPFGIGVERLMDNLYGGRSAVVNLKGKWEKEIEDLQCWIGAPVQEDLNEKKAIPRKNRRSMGRLAILSALAAQQALNDAHIPVDLHGLGRMGICFSSTTGSPSSLQTFFTESCLHSQIRGLPSGIFFQCMSHTTAANIAHLFNIKGMVLSPNAACASSTQSIGLAYELVRLGLQDIMLCGGAEELHSIVSGSFDLLQASSIHFNDKPHCSPRPFDADRDGTVCGEGSGALVIETEESALERGARIWGRIAGFATRCDGTHLSEPNKDAVLDCMRVCLESGCVSPREIDYINAHATGTIKGDLEEAIGITELFGSHTPPVSGLKGHIGHTLGASGALETIACLDMLDRGRLIPTLNLDNPDKECSNINHVKSAQEDVDLSYILKNSFAFGGTNSVLLLKRYEHE